MGLFQKPPTGSFILFYILVLIYFFKYETIVRSSAWCSGHSDPDPSSVECHQKLAALIHRNRYSDPHKTA